LPHLELLHVGQADAFASTRQYLLRAAKKLAGSRVLADYLNRGVVPKGHPGWLAYVTEFIEGSKASGLVQKAIDRHIRPGAFAGDPN
jgi:hypothetical protein